MEGFNHVLRNALASLQGIIRHNCKQCERECSDIMLERIKQAYDACERINLLQSQKER